MLEQNNYNRKSETITYCNLKPGLRFVMYKIQLATA